MEVNQTRGAESTFPNTNTKPETTNKRDRLGGCAQSQSWFFTGTISTHTNETGLAKHFAVSPHFSFLLFSPSEQIALSERGDSLSIAQAKITRKKQIV